MEQCLYVIIVCMVNASRRQRVVDGIVIIVERRRRREKLIARRRKGAAAETMNHTQAADGAWGGVGVGGTKSILLYSRVRTREYARRTHVACQALGVGNGYGRYPRASPVGARRWRACPSELENAPPARAVVAGEPRPTRTAPAGRAVGGRAGGRATRTQQNARPPRVPYPLTFGRAGFIYDARP